MFLSGCDQLKNKEMWQGLIKLWDIDKEDEQNILAMRDNVWEDKNDQSVQSSLKEQTKEVYLRKETVDAD